MKRWCNQKTQRDYDSQPETKGVCNVGGAADTLYGENKVKVKEEPALKRWITVMHPGESGKETWRIKVREAAQTELRPGSCWSAPSCLRITRFPSSSSPWRRSVWLWSSAASWPWAGPSRSTSPARWARGTRASVSTSGSSATTKASQASAPCATPTATSCLSSAGRRSDTAGAWTSWAARRSHTLRLLWEPNLTVVRDDCWYCSAVASLDQISEYVKLLMCWFAVDEFYCPQGWSYFEKKCFTFIDTPKTWVEAEVRWTRWGRTV